MAHPSSLAKTFVGGVFLLNPLLLAAGLIALSDQMHPAWLRPVGVGLALLNVLTLGTSIGYVIEVMRRAISDRPTFFPGWTARRLWRGTLDGWGGLLLAVPTCLLPTACWVLLCWGVIDLLLGLPLWLILLSPVPPLLIGFPLWLIALSRWVSGTPIWNAFFRIDLAWQVLVWRTGEFVGLTAEAVGAVLAGGALIVAAPFVCFTVLVGSAMRGGTIVAELLGSEEIEQDDEE